MPKIIVISDRPNITSLPYKIKGAAGVFDFLPGRNEIDADIMGAIVKEAGADMKHYQKFLKPLNAEIGDDGDPDLSGLSADAFLTLIENTMDLGTLLQYRVAEDAGKKRKTVIAAISAQAAKIDEIDKKKAGM